MGKINFLWMHEWGPEFLYWVKEAILNLREACGAFLMGFLNLPTLIKKPRKLDSYLKGGPVPLPKSG